MCMTCENILHSATYRKETMHQLALSRANDSMTWTFHKPCSKLQTLRYFWVVWSMNKPTKSNSKRMNQQTAGTKGKNELRRQSSVLASQLRRQIYWRYFKIAKGKMIRSVHPSWRESKHGKKGYWRKHGVPAIDPKNHHPTSDWQGANGLRSWTRYANESTKAWLVMP